MLGAGFSRAVSEHMPLMLDLDRDVCAALDARARENPGAAKLPPTVEQFGSDLEAWLSHLAVDQPWLPRAENLRNRAMFLEVSGLVWDVLTVAETHATKPEIPRWLAQLAGYWLRSESTVITFNYDLLVEYAYLRAAEPPYNAASLYR